MAHELTEDEVRQRFLEHVWGMVDYWERETRATTMRERLEGLAFTLLSTLDGCAMDLPAFIVAPCPHPDDKAFNQGEGDDWWPENHEADVQCDISGGLHELFSGVRPKR